MSCFACFVKFSLQKYKKNCTCPNKIVILRRFVEKQAFFATNIQLLTKNYLKMKRFFSFLCALTIILGASAARLQKGTLQKMLSNQPIKVEQVTKAVKAPQAKAETPFASGTFYTVGGTFYAYDGSDWAVATSYMPSVEVTVDGDQVSIVGLAYWFKDGAVNGTLTGNTITIPSGQLVGTDEYGDEFLVGSDDGETVSESIVFEYDPETGTLSAATNYIFESASTAELQVYCYWSGAVFGLEAPETPEAVVLPEGVETSLYKFDGHDVYYDTQTVKYVYVGFDGADVYIQGMSDAVPEGWIKGTKDAEGTYEFAECYLGIYESMFGDFEVYAQATTMTYDAEKDQFSCASFTSTIEEELWDEFEAITLSKFTEVAATPADPKFKDFVFANTDYPHVDFEIPLVGTNEEDLNPEKLSYIFFIQKGNEESPLVFTTDLYEYLEAEMTEIPYSFSDDWDFYNNRTYLNQSEEVVRSWEKLGLQSIYRGAGEEHKSNIVWFDVKAYWAEVDSEQGIENIELTEKAQKVAVDGVLYIIRDNKMYNVQGARVR